MTAIRVRLRLDIRPLGRHLPVPMQVFARLEAKVEALAYLLGCVVAAALSLTVISCTLELPARHMLFVFSPGWCQRG